MGWFGKNCGGCRCGACCENLSRTQVIVIEVSGFVAACTPDRSGVFNFEYSGVTNDTGCLFGTSGPWTLYLLDNSGDCTWRLIDQDENYQFDLVRNEDCCPDEATSMVYSGDTSDGCAGATPAATLTCSEGTPSACECIGDVPQYLLIEIEAMANDYLTCCTQFNAAYVIELTTNTSESCLWRDTFDCTDLDFACCGEAFIAAPSTAVTVDNAIVSANVDALNHNLTVFVGIYDGVQSAFGFDFSYSYNAELDANKWRDCKTFSRFEVPFNRTYFEPTSNCDESAVKCYVTSI